MCSHLQIDSRTKLIAKGEIYAGELVQNLYRHAWDISFADAVRTWLPRSHQCNQIKISIERGFDEKKETRATQFSWRKLHYSVESSSLRGVTRWRYIFRAGIDFRVCSRYFDFRDGVAAVDRNFLNSNHVGRLSLAPFSRLWYRNVPRYRVLEIETFLGEPMCR